VIVDLSHPMAADDPDSYRHWPLGALDPDQLCATAWRPVPFRQFILSLHGRCNLACTYCYLYAMGDESWRSRPPVMSDAVMARMSERIEQVDTLRAAFPGAAPTALDVFTHPLDVALGHPSVAARQIGRRVAAGISALAPAAP
jgi:sulfatase maturation enzyme AslB (radical SAM superfamily)